MKHPEHTLRWAWAVVLATCLLAPAAAETDRLTALLDEFMVAASSNDASMHQRFWDEELVYTSSAGARFGKAEILAGLAAATAASEVTYTAEDVDVRLHGHIAVVTFRLVARYADERREEFYNTGVFRLRDGDWRAVTWQATRRASAEQ
jgi:hypothetical protein